MILRLENPIRDYAWGSHEAIAKFLGRQAPTQRPQAELWIGAHVDDSSIVAVDGGATPLVWLLAEDPELWLGKATIKRFGMQLPYLMKVLAAASPLSLQAHPSIEQARVGYDDEERRGIPRQASNRNYRDRNHKPELLCALSPFEALCGFRPVPDILDCMQRLDTPELEQLTGRLRRENAATALKGLVEYLLVAPPGRHQKLVSNALSAAERQIKAGDPEADHLRWIVELGRVYPGDVGVVTALLLNYVKLDVGQAIYLPARSLHTYLSGLGVEIMASSDNVLRGGLTPKHVDAAELLRVLSFEPIAPPIILPTPVSSVEAAYVTPAADFRLSRITLAGTLQLEPFGPELLLCIEGSCSLNSNGSGTLQLNQGESVFVAASTKHLQLTGNALIFRATIGIA
ncbi:MAG TPA: mannose-6-phosphate isomerase, class I [Polyangiaceae bacterium]